MRIFLPVFAAMAVMMAGTGFDGSQAETKQDCETKPQPEISVRYDNNLPARIADGRGYYCEGRTARVTVAEWTGIFEEQQMTEELLGSITAVDGKGEQIERNRVVAVGEWEQKQEGIVLDDAEMSGQEVEEDAGEILPQPWVYETTVTFLGDANYIFQPSCTDSKGTKSCPADYGDSVTPEYFSVDRGMPAGAVTVRSEDGRERVRTEFATDPAVNFLPGETVFVTCEAEDAVSPVESIRYFRTDAALDLKELQRVAVWEPLCGSVSVAGGPCIVYLRLEDLAGNVCFLSTDVLIADGTPPEVTVRYDNNRAQNGSYFHAPRTAIVTVVEKNFDAGRVVFLQTASCDNRAAQPQKPVWTQKGDVHTARISFSEDGEYTFDVSVTDLAGNVCEEVDYGDSAAPRAFVIDTAIHAPTLFGVKDCAVYRSGVRISAVFADANYEEGEIFLYRTHLTQADGRVRERREDVTKQLQTQETSARPGENRVDFVIAPTRENDGIYILHARIADLAGNEKEERICFTVNRFGSVYAVSDYLMHGLRGAYVRQVEQDLVITEYNASPLKDLWTVEITRDGASADGFKVDREMVSSGRTLQQEGGWYQYRYTIRADGFQPAGEEKADGFYRICVSSRDMAGNCPETENYPEYDLRFCVDSTEPAFTGIRRKGDLQPQNGGQTYVFDALDTIGLERVEAYLGERLIGAFRTGEDRTRIRGEITVLPGEESRVRLLAVDLAGNTARTGLDPSDLERTSSKNDRGPASQIIADTFSELLSNGISRKTVGAAAAKLPSVIPRLVRSVKERSAGQPLPRETYGGAALVAASASAGLILAAIGGRKRKKQGKPSE